ncbi:hypothetical protein RFI_19521 [Reticulomyxa filosa]|uniref:Uncharacterized protein n=1 Tax=Reticulomyxa filosa TaxID=46433 RepID=X6MWD1_RETFI|nr:hypothetical protein RFI_19521 [Reticulomyxa filosa]|eukprot:ETO17792.1 hypothetical protein RFI_19521 [Reticulomyxa filosa]
MILHWRLTSLARRSIERKIKTLQLHESRVNGRIRIRICGVPFGKKTGKKQSKVLYEDEKEVKRAYNDNDNDSKSSEDESADNNDDININVVDIIKKNEQEIDIPYDKHYAVLSDLQEQYSYTISVRTIFSWPSQKESASQWSESITVSTFKDFQGFLNCLFVCSNGWEK